MAITSIVLNEKYSDKQAMMEALAKKNFNAEKALSSCGSQLISGVNPMIFSLIDPKIKEGESLSFEESFYGMLLAVAATNNPIRQKLFPKMSLSDAIAKGVGFLTSMAIKEAIFELTPEEIAGMSAAGMTDVVFRPYLPKVVETCGMGGDRGWGTKEIKTINASTLSAFILASLEIPTFKHGSYGNTSKIGSTDIPVNFGAKICQHTAEEILKIFKETHFWFSDAHSVKTIHYLSHCLMVETVNHIVGPMTIPISRKTKLFKVMGVNHNVSPEAIARAYTILHQKGFVNLGGIIVVAGLDEVPEEKEYLNPQWTKKHLFLDEVSPRATLVSLAKGKDFLGNFLLTDENFGDGPILEETLKIKNAAQPLMQADEIAIRGKNENLSRYLARNAALGLLLHNGLDNSNPFALLPCCFRLCLETISSGRAFETLKDYVSASGGNFRSWL